MRSKDLQIPDVEELEKIERFIPGRRTKLICHWCREEITWTGQQWVHKATMSLYVCSHGKAPLTCCGRDHHCVLVERVFLS